MNRFKKGISLFCVLLLALSLAPAALAGSSDPDLDPPITLYVKASDTPVYKSANTSSAVLCYLSANEAVQVYFLGNTYARVKHEGANAYMLIKQLTDVDPNPPAAIDPEPEITPPTATHTLKVAADLLDSPSSSGAKIASLAAGTEVAVVFVTSTEWARVAVEDKLGYLAASALTKIEEEGGEEDDGESAAPLATAKVKGGNLALRSSPERKASNLIDYYPTGTVVTILGKNGEWAKVQVKGTNGYMMFSYLAIDATEEETDPAEDSDLSVISECIVQSPNKGPVALRKGPSKSKGIIDFFPIGTEAKLHKREGDWSFVTIGGKTGYMMTEFLAAKPAEVEPPESDDPESPGEDETEGDEEEPPAPVGTPMYVKTGNSGGLALRSSPKKTASNLLDFYPNDTSVLVLSVSGDWAQVLVAGKGGYMMKSMLSLFPSSAPADDPETPPETDGEQDEGENPETPSVPSLPAALTVKHPKSSFVNLRSTPTDNSTANIISKIKSGTVVEVLGVKGPFTKVRADGQEGYMNSSYLK